MRKTALLFALIIFCFFQDGITFAQDLQWRFSLPAVFEYPTVKGRDPFSSLVQPKKKPEERPEKRPVPVITKSEYRVIGLVWDGGADVALITRGMNVWVAKEGEVIDGLKVARIKGKEGEVVLVGEDKIIKLKMLDI